MSSNLSKQALKSILPKRILWRMFFIVILPMILLQTVIGIVFYREYIHNQIESSIDLTISHIEYIKKNYDGEIFLDNFSDIYGGEYKILSSYNIKDHDCSLSGIMYLVKNELDRRGYEYQICKAEEEKSYQLLVKLNNSNILQVTYNRKFFLVSQWHFLPVWSVGVSLLLVIIAFVFLRNQMKPVSRLGKAAKAFANGDNSYKLYPSGANEIRQATKAFIEMRKQIAKNIQNRTLLLAGISHDLRTILTRFSLELSMMDKNDSTESLIEDSKRMKDILESYLDFTSYEVKEEYVETFPKNIIDNIIIKYPNLNIETSYSGENKIFLRPQSFERIILNLVSNASRFASHLIINVNITSDNIKVVIEDNGKGVSEDMYEDIFKPFVSCDTQNHYSGLGLALTKDIVQSHGGKIWAESSKKLGGLNITFEM